MLRPALLIGACLLAAACKPAAEQASVHEQEAARAEQLQTLKGWDRAFGAPDAAVGATNQFGFRAAPYAAAGQGFESKGGPVTIASGAKPAQVSFTATGATAGKVDRIAFTLALGDADAAKLARERFAKLIGDYLFQFGLKDEGITGAVAAGQDADGLVEGAPASVATSPDSIIVTFTRPADSAPAKQPQGQ